jgi:glucose-1-phosphate thymidylyltransferase
MIAIILAAGFGTRMYPLTKNCAKALLPLNGKKVIDHIVKRLVGFEEIVIVTNNKFYNDFEEWKNDKRIRIINNNVDNVEDAKGWVNDLTIGLKNIEKDFLVLSSDNVFCYDLNKMMKQFNKKPLIAVTKTTIEKASKHGIVVLKDNKVISFEEKPLKPKSLTKSILCYMIPKEFIKTIRDFNKTNSKKHLIEFLLEKTSVEAFYFDEVCHDIGCMESYKKAEILEELK